MKDSRFNRIYIVGFMGVGKTTLARKLGEHLGKSVIDLDHFIEERKFKTVPQLFTEHGEDGFRIIEQQMLKELSDFDDVIVSTGGGAPCFFDNMEVMNAAGVTVFIDLPPEIIAQRLLKSKTERPLIKGKTETELQDFIAERLNERRPFYGKSEIVVKPTNQTPEEVMHMILEHLKD